MVYLSDRAVKLKRKQLVAQAFAIGSVRSVPVNESGENETTTDLKSADLDHEP